MTARSADALLLLDGIGLAFGGVRALDDVSFDIRTGEIRALIGPNGAGKSSLLNVIGGVYRAETGTVTYKGYVRPARKAYRAAAVGIARTFQNLALFKGMTVLENVMTGRAVHMAASLWLQALPFGPARREERANRIHAEGIIDFLGLTAYRDGPVATLPYGVQKRVELARALAAEPDLLLLDEPMAGMNADEKRDMCRFIVDANKTFGVTVALIEHDMGVVMDLSDRVVVLDHGRVIADGTPDAVAADPAVIDAYLGAG